MITAKAHINWNAELRSQLEWHWTNQLRPRLADLTDEEYFWEPVRGSWNVRPRGQSTAPMAVGAGAYTIDFAIPEPTPAPVTTIAWRIGHLVVGVFGARNASHFDGPAIDYENHNYAATAADSLDQLDAGYSRWIDGVTGLGHDELAEPCGPAEGPFADWSMAALVLHIHREVLHHGAEIALLRDLYAWRNA
ncbi:DinB family protein [Arthrobacter castelli]|uniref:DinB family protein n=1 Tax=Arthrobacter castelli TaxID=271431 RepID=UPI00041CC970|nr:DinB family protein [Arthrobacter castelli]